MKIIILLQHALNAGRGVESIEKTKCSNIHIYTFSEEKNVQEVENSICEKSYWQEIYVQCGSKSTQEEERVKT